MPIASTASSLLFRRLDHRYSDASYRSDEETIDDASSYDDDDSILCASPSSAAHGGKPSKHSLKEQHRHQATIRKRPSLLQKYYGNADLSDRIGRTLSFFLLTRFIVSILAACVLEEE